MNKWTTAAVGIIVLQAVVLYLFGQPPICTCGYVKFWEGVVLGPGNSQHLADWYTFSHIVHGLLFYAALRYVFPKMTLWRRLVYAMGVEIAWEIIENTPMVIAHYREQALSQGYIGDSIINSVSDTIAMILGFIIASRVRIWIAIALGLCLELFAAYMIRDNLTLNVLNFIHTFPSIAAWQTGM